MVDYLARGCAGCQATKRCKYIRAPLDLCLLDSLSSFTVSSFGFCNKTPLNLIYKVSFPLPVPGITPINSTNERVALPGTRVVDKLELPTLPSMYVYEYLNV